MSIDSTALAKLRTVLSPSAAAHLPGEPGYSNKRWALNAEKEAAVVVCPATPEDVVQILAFVQGKAPYESQSKLSFSVKSGGYDWSGTSSCEGGLVIDLRPNMQDIRIDPTAKLAFVGAGCIWGQVDQAAIIHGLAAVAGISDQIGVGGLTLDGGFGWLCGQHGLVIDNVVRMTVVTASGNILTASREENSDLFWALRGGGNNFAIVVEIVYQLHEQQSQVYTSMLVFPPAKVGPVFSELNKWLSERTDAENAICVFTAGTAGQPVLVLNFVYNGESDEGARRFERFKKLDPVRDQSGAIPYTKLNTLQNEHTKDGELRLLEGNFIPATATGITAEFAVDIYSTWLKFIKNYPAAEKSTVVIELFHPEKWSSVAPDATAYTNRYPVYNVIYMVNWVDHTFTQLALDATHRLDDEFTKLRKEHFTGNPLQSATLSRFIGKNNSLETKYGKNYPRLMEIKRKYDSNGLFGKWVPTRSQPTV